MQRSRAASPYSSRSGTPIRSLPVRGNLKSVMCKLAVAGLSCMFVMLGFLQEDLGMTSPCFQDYE